ncbi:hypothetical protein E3N88_20399 [Mikania micrantha]|uniref:Uncharacterized protein n=1 Tax=Mikania micrantha TaxID=192012 RepID=A0A5N6NGV7_9ASTR|nr:hypothetical protein E3N88_20399 [Mikania micrantha]
MSLDETTPVENQSYTTLSPGGTTVIQGKGKGKGLFNDSNENVRNPEITPEFLAQNRKQILLLLQKEDKEQQLKEARARLEFEDVLVEDVGEDDAEVEAKLDKETSQPKIQEGRKENHEDGLNSQIAKKDCTPKKQAPSVWNLSKGQEEKRWERSRFQPRDGALQPGFGVPRKSVTESEKTPHADEKRKEIFMLHQLRATVALKRPRDIGGAKQNSNHLQPWMEQDISFLPIRGGNFASNPLTVSAIIAGHNVHQVYVDTGSALEIMYEHCFLQLDEVIQISLIKSTHVLTGFAGEVVHPVGQIQLPVVIGNETEGAFEHQMITRPHKSREPRLREKEKQVSRLEEKAHAAAEEEKAGAAGHGQRRNHMSRLGEKTRAAAEEEGAGRGQEQVCRGWGRSFCHDRGRKLESQKRKQRVVIQAAVGEKANSLL